MELEPSKSAIQLERIAECMLHWKGRQMTVSTKNLPLPPLARHSFPP